MRILIAEDEPVARRLLEQSLTLWGYQVFTATDGSQAWEILSQADGPSLAILDWMMPGVDGPELCRRVRGQAREPYVYVILLTERHGQSDVVEGLKAGADDFVRKPFDDEELRARVRTGERIVRLQRDLFASRQAMLSMATTDELTALLNRPAILNFLAREMNRSVREGSSLSVALADIDHFKAINDAHGHQAGDVVLREVARRLTAPLRNYDAVGRFGGEEFLLVLPGCDAATGQMLAGRMLANLSTQPVLAGPANIPVTISVGVAHYEGMRGIDPLEIVHAADEALYRAKINGRNRFEIAATPVPRKAPGGRPTGTAGP